MTGNNPHNPDVNENYLPRQKKPVLERLSQFSYFILPAILFITGLFLKERIPFYYLTHVDPEYCYLFNGLNVAHLNFPWHIDHPGTPLQMLAAVVIRIVHLFRGGQTLDADVFQNPELYLNAINCTLIGINSFFLLVCGYLVGKATKNVFTGLFFQLIPFASYTVITILNRVIVEQLFISLVLVLMAVVMFYLNRKEVSGKLFDRYIVLFSLVISIGMADKIIFFPLAFIPLIILKGIRKKTAYSLLTFFFFAVLIFPIYNRWGYFRDWVENLFLHSGYYGQGAATVIDPGSFFRNLKFIIQTDFLFPVSYFIIITAVITYHLPALKLKTSDDKEYRALAGIALAMTFMIILVAKHFKYFYLTPVLLLIMPGLYLTVSVFTRRLQVLKQKWIIISSLAGVVVILYFAEHSNLFADQVLSKDRKIPKINTLHTVEKEYLNKPLLIVSDYYGAPFKEYALFFGYSWCGSKMSGWYKNELSRDYPNSYIYHTWNNLFNNWDNAYSFHDLLKKYSSLLLFVGDADLEKNLQSKIHGLNRQCDTKIRSLYQNTQSPESIYELTYDSNAVLPGKTFTFDAEEPDESRMFFRNRDGILIENGNTQSNEEARSGKYSIKLIKDKPVGMKAVWSEVKKDEHFTISVWMFDNNNQNSGLVVSCKDTSLFYVFESKEIAEEGKWQKIEVKIIIPEKINNQDLFIYCRNNNTETPAFFDDLKIVCE